MHLISIWYHEYRIDGLIQWIRGNLSICVFPSNNMIICEFLTILEFQFGVVQLFWIYAEINVSDTLFDGRIKSSLITFCLLSNIKSSPGCTYYESNTNIRKIVCFIGSGEISVFEFSPVLVSFPPIRGNLSI